MSKLPRKSRRARRSKRSQPSARIWQFEQLESRAMLAVMGAMPYDGGNHGPQLQSFAEPRPFQTAMFAPAQFEQHWAAGPEQHRWAFSGPMADGFHEDRLIFREYSESVEVWSIGPPNLQHSSYSQGPPPVVDFEPAALDIAGWNSNIYPLPNTNQPGNTKTSVASDKPQQPPVPPGTKSNQIDYALPGVRNTGYYDLAFYRLIAASSTSTTVTTQTTARELESAAFAWTGALDAALQSYTSQLLLATSTTNSQLATSLKSNDQALPISDTSDGFIHLSDSVSQDLFVAYTDAIAQERAAVEEVLKSLKDADSLPSNLDGGEVANAFAAPSERDGQIADLVFGGTFDLADADGGMVLLKATGDANQSPINLASIADAHPDFFSGHAEVEPSVGLYQAIDMGFEELSATENVPVAKPSAQPAQQAKPGNHYSTNDTNSRKSGTALAVSTLVGGLLSVASRKRIDEDRAQLTTTARLVH